MACPTKSIYEQSAGACPGIQAQWEMNQPPKPHHFWCPGDISSYWLACLCNSLQMAMGCSWGPKVVLPLEIFLLSFLCVTDRKPRPLLLPDMLGTKTVGGLGRQAVPHEVVRDNNCNFPFGVIKGINSTTNSAEEDIPFQTKCN